MTNPETDNNDTKQMVIEDSMFNDFDAINAGWLVGAMTNMGIVRSNNEDSIYSFFTKLEDTDTVPSFGIFIVADGAGGQLNGEVASALTMRTVAKQLINKIYVPLLNNEDINELDRPTISDVITEAIQESDRLVREQVPDGGCTCTVAVITGNIVNIGHVGDSRLYMIHGSHIEQITRDHSIVARLMEIGDIDASEAKSHPQRSVLYRGVGMGREENIDVDIMRKRLKTGDQLLICSDGLWEMVDDADIQDIINQSKIPQDACRALITKANLNGGHDNISVVIVTGPEH
ncbi:MAG: protein phosphatase 2C domain-containing protein [Phototrophicaceae bacterium]